MITGSAGLPSVVTMIMPPVVAPPVTDPSVHIVIWAFVSRIDNLVCEGSLVVSALGSSFFTLWTYKRQLRQARQWRRWPKVNLVPCWRIKVVMLLASASQSGSSDRIGHWGQSHECCPAALQENFCYAGIIFLDNFNLSKACTTLRAIDFGMFRQIIGLSALLGLLKWAHSIGPGNNWHIYFAHA